MLVAEVMLQQTQVRRVVPAWERFLGRFPTPAALAAAPLADVLRAWQGLGYNRRAAALWRTAGVIVAEHGGAVPSSPADLRRLPGVGPYTAAAVAACAFGAPVAAVDTNLRRVVSRARLGVDQAASASVAAAAGEWLDRSDPAGWNQALMDLGREVCTQVPRCEGCPLRYSCRFRSGGGASPAPRARAGRPAPPFEGSSRQLRGRIIATLAGSESTLEGLAAECGRAVDRVAAQVTALASEGLVSVGNDGIVRLG